MSQDLNQIRNTCRDALIPDSAARGSGPAGRVLGAIALAVGVVSPIALTAQERPVPDTFEAVTVDMTPAGQAIKIDIVDWSDEAERAAVIAALGSEAQNVEAALRELPTAGYVWLDGSGVGYAVKYAHRTRGDDGGEAVTIVTDRQLGAYSYLSWTAPTAGEPLGYSVLELDLDAEGRGVGTLSLVADVEIDPESGTIDLEPRATVLADAIRRPKPYWAQGESPADSY